MSEGAASPAMPGRGAVTGAVLIGGLAVTQIVAMPLLAPMIATAFGASSADSGLVGLANLFGTALGSLFVTIRLGVLRPRQTALVSTLIACLAQLAVGFVPSFPVAVILEGLAGAGAGVLLAQSAAIVGASRNSDRGFGFILALQALVAVIVLLLLPLFSAAPGLWHAEAVLAAIQALLIPASLGLSAARPAPLALSAEGQPPRLPSTVWILAGAYFAFSAAVGVIWVFSGVLGDMAGISVHAIGHALAIGNIAAIIGSLLAAAVTTRFGRLLPLFCVCVILMAGAVLFSPRMTLPLFYVASNLYLFAWGCGLPFFMGAVAEDDPTDRVTALLPVISFAGMGVGPAVVPLLPVGGLFGQVIVTTLLFGVAAILLAVIARLFQKRAARQPA